MSDDRAAALWDRHFRDPEGAFVEAQALLRDAEDLAPGVRAFWHEDTPLWLSVEDFDERKDGYRGCAQQDCDLSPREVFGFLQILVKCFFDCV